MTKKTEMAISIVLTELDRVNNDKENVSFKAVNFEDDFGNEFTLIVKKIDENISEVLSFENNKEQLVTYNYSSCTVLENIILSPLLEILGD